MLYLKHKLIVLRNVKSKFVLLKSTLEHKVGLDISLMVCDSVPILCITASENEIQALINALPSSPLSAEIVAIHEISADINALPSVPIASETSVENIIEVFINALPSVPIASEVKAINIVKAYIKAAPAVAIKSETVKALVEVTAAMITKSTERVAARIALKNDVTAELSAIKGIIDIQATLKQIVSVKAEMHLVAFAEIFSELKIINTLISNVSLMTAAPAKAEISNELKILAALHAAANIPVSAVIENGSKVTANMGIVQYAKLAAATNVKTDIVAQLSTIESLANMQASIQAATTVKAEVSLVNFLNALAEAKITNAVDGKITTLPPTPAKAAVMGAAEAWAALTPLPPIPAKVTIADNIKVSGKMDLVKKAKLKDYKGKRLSEMGGTTLQNLSYLEIN